MKNKIIGLNNEFGFKTGKLTAMKKFALIILFLSFEIYNYAQNLEFKATAAPRVLKTGEQFRLVYELNQDVSDLEIPEFKDFQLIGGPMTGSSTSIQIINGKTTQSSQYTYTYYLKAIKEGTYSIPPAKTKYKGKVYESNAVSIEVVGGGTPQQQQGNSPAQGQNQQQASSDANIKTGEDVFVRIHIDKRSVYLGEQVVAWIKLYTKLPISGIDNQFTGPEYSGFYKQPVEIPPLRSLERENVNGDIYYTGVIQKVVLYPQKTGELIIEPFDLDVSVQQQVRNRSRSVFDDFFGPTVTDVPIKLKGNSVKINVKALPPKPKNYTGAVGSFTMNTSVDKLSLKTNEALTYKVTISGKGNIKLFDNPTIAFPPNIEQFDPKITINQSSELSGTKTFEYVLIPRFAGTFKIPSFEFAYFDPSKENFVKLTSDEYEVYVEKGTEDTSTVVVSGLTKEDFRLLGSDILFIKNKPFKLFSQNKFIFGSIWFYLVYIGSFIALILIIVFRRETIKRRANTALTRNKKANKVAKKRFKNAHHFMKQNKREKFYEEMMKALWGYLSDKLAIPVSELSRESSREELRQRNVNEALVNELYSLMDQCEYARFAPGAVSDGMDKQYKHSIELVGKLEQELK